MRLQRLRRVAIVFGLVLACIVDSSAASFAAADPLSGADDSAWQQLGAAMHRPLAWGTLLLAGTLIAARLVFRWVRRAAG